MANTITQRQGCWLQYQMKLNGYTQVQLAEIANRSTRIVSQFLTGRKGSEPVKMALCKVLGYEDFDLLLDAIPREAGGRNRKGSAA
jgi:transcriptional regulator with XRE-family HTH domain